MFRFTLDSGVAPAAVKVVMLLKHNSRISFLRVSIRVRVRG